MEDAAHLLLCDGCCDAGGIFKEAQKTGGCTCDVCGFACACCSDPEIRHQYINRIAVRTIPAEAWTALQERNQRSLTPLDWEKLFLLGRE
ncbi:MAG: hypothetical protein ACOCVM_08065 [Desulfovibrionaceae bacterium]